MPFACPSGPVHTLSTPGEGAGDVPWPSPGGTVLLNCTSDRVHTGWGGRVEGWRAKRADPFPVSPAGPLTQQTFAGHTRYVAGALWVLEGLW